MKNVAAFTICAKNFLGAALVLRKSLEDTNPGLDFYIFIADGRHNDLDHDLGKNVVYCEDKFLISDHMKYKYSVTEYCTYLKPVCFKMLFESYDELIYLDPDICVYSSLGAILQNFATGALAILTPHLCEISLNDKPYSEVNHLFEGVYNFGFLGLAKDQLTIELLNWWESRLDLYCYGDKSLLLHTDQAWGSYFPCFLREKCCILDHRGCNVAHWNLNERNLQKVEKNQYTVNGEFELIFFHFSGFDFFGEGLIKRGGHAVVKMSNELRELASDYRLALKAAGHEDFLIIPYEFSRLPRSSAVLGLFQRRMIIDEEMFHDKSIDFIEDCLRRNNAIDLRLTSHSGYGSTEESNFTSKMTIVRILLKIMFRFFGVSRYSRLVRLFNFLGKEQNHQFLIKR